MYDPSAIIKCQQNIQYPISAIGLNFILNELNIPSLLWQLTCELLWNTYSANTYVTKEGELYVALVLAFLWKYTFIRKNIFESASLNTLVVSYMSK